MEKHYIPQKAISGKFPVVITLPGMLHHSEKGRCDTILSDLNNQGIYGINLYTIDSFVKERNQAGAYSPQNTPSKVEFRVDIQNSVKRLRVCIEKIQNDDRFNNENIGIFASSIGAAIAGQYISKYPKDHGITAYASLSPLPGWPQFANEETTKNILKSGRDLQLPHDEGTICTRYIPYSNLADITKIDSISSLKASPPISPIEIMTIIGGKDSISNVNAMEEYHSLLGGSEEGRLFFPEERHSIPHSKYEPELIRFFNRNLKEPISSRQILKAHSNQLKELEKMQGPPSRHLEQKEEPAQLLQRMYSLDKLS